MATVTKGLYLASGGVFRHSTAVTTTEFTTASNQYAIVTLTNLYIIITGGGGAGATSCNVNLGGTIIAQAVTDGVAGSNAIVVQSIQAVPNVPLVASGASAIAQVSSMQIYVPPSTAFNTVLGAVTGVSMVVSGSYIIYQNT